MSDWIIEAFNEKLRLVMENMAIEELNKLTKDQLIDFIVSNFDLMRPQKDE